MERDDRFERIGEVPAPIRLALRVGLLAAIVGVRQVVDAVAGRLTGFALSKGTIRFTAAEPLPDDVLRDLVRLRQAEIEG